MNNWERQLQQQMAMLKQFEDLLRMQREFEKLTAYSDQLKIYDTHARQLKQLGDFSHFKLYADTVEAWRNASMHAHPGIATFNFDEGILIAAKGDEPDGGFDHLWPKNRKMRLKGNSNSHAQNRAKLTAAKVALPPAGKMLRLGRLLLSKKSYAEVLVPTVSDMRVEYYEALKDGDHSLARAVLVRGRFSILKVIFLSLPLGWLRKWVLG